ncbi:MAG TPA: GNAT family N-acetyltransferase [Propionibacteriaceae bacterium]|nr:GNAT family N-acetyltransferase [Propionibacteriaceae bacterium]
MITVERNDALSRYEGRVAGELVTVVNFVRSGNVLDITHTRTRQRRRGNGFAGKVTEAALADIRAEGWKVHPTCPFTVDYLHTHPEYADLRA